jgi:glycosyltransferase involved in cell wall biosynthesis
MLVCDAMLDLKGGIQPAIYLAEGLKRVGYNVSIISPIMSEKVESNLYDMGILPRNLKINLVTNNLGISLSWFELWSREAFLRLNSKSIIDDLNVTINFSHTIVIPSKFWYVQGPTSIALKEGENEFLGLNKLGYKILKPIINYADEKLTLDTAKKTMLVIANSKYCGSLYQKNGVVINEIIYPPIDCQVFNPQTSNPSGDYVLTYFGKETRFSLIKRVADLGVNIRAFGSKIPFMPKSLTKHPNVEFLGKIPNGELIQLYSNALYTFFPFTHEPFGYVPVESMACGTPTLTYNKQGPGEYIVDGYDGWLANSDEELVEKALMLWNKKYPSKIRINSIKKALNFDKELYLKKWLEKMNNYLKI